jgi:hypothetical protein
MGSYICNIVINNPYEQLIFEGMICMGLFFKEI